MTAPNGSLGKRGHIRAELRFMARAFFPAFLGTIVLFGVLYAIIIAVGETEPGAPSKAVLVPVAFGYGAFVGFWPALVVGGARLCWALVGGWTLVPLTLIPLALVLALWLAAGTFAGLVDGLGQAVITAGSEHEWNAISAGRGLAHAGPIGLVIVLPLLLVDLGAIALDPGVLWAMFELLLVFALVVAAAVLPAAVVSAVVLAGAYAGRLRARIEARRASSGSEAAAPGS